MERSNLNLRMGVRRFTRLTNAFGKKLENQVHSLALWLVYYKLRPRAQDAAYDPGRGRRPDRYAARHGLAGGSGRGGSPQAGAAGAEAGGEVPPPAEGCRIADGQPTAEMSKDNPGLVRCKLHFSCHAV